MNELLIGAWLFVCIIFVSIALFERAQGIGYDMSIWWIDKTPPALTCFVKDYLRDSPDIQHAIVRWLLDQVIAGFYLVFLIQLAIDQVYFYLIPIIIILTITYFLANNSE